MSESWTCFHCDETFIDPDEARIHFGTHPDATPACIIHGSALHGLAVRVRELERQIVAMQDESDPVSVYWYEIQGKHRQEVKDAEQKGYDRGLTDGMALTGNAE